MPKRYVHLLVNLLFPLAAAAVLVLSLLPTLAVPETGIPFTDKLLHTAAYLVLGSLGYLFFYTKKQHKLQALVLSVIICTLWGAGIEILQGYTGRTPELLDGIMDFCGAALGTLITRKVAPA
jgi:VanZ family protein